MEAWWPHSYCARPWIERSGFKPWPGTLCCVLGQDGPLTLPLNLPVGDEIHSKSNSFVAYLITTTVFLK